MGSINGTIKDVIDEMRADGVAIGLVTLVAFRPFPTDALRQALARARDVIVIDKAVDVGMGGPLASNIAIALRELADPPAMHSAIVGLGGRPVPKASLHRLFRQAAIQPWEGPHFLDLNERVVAREIHRRGKTRRVGPAAEGILKQLEKERVEKLAERDAMNEVQKLKFYQKGTLTVGNRLVDEARAQRAGEPRPLELADLGPSRLPGLRRGARRALRHRRGDARRRAQAHRRQRDRLPRSVHDALSRDVVADPLDAFAVRQRGGGCDRRRGGDAGARARTRRAWSRKAATAARPTSASAASPACSSATTTCSTSATTTKAT